MSLTGRHSYCKLFILLTVVVLSSDVSAAFPVSRSLLPFLSALPPPLAIFPSSSCFKHDHSLPPLSLPLYFLPSPLLPLSPQRFESGVDDTWRKHLWVDTRCLPMVSIQGFSLLSCLLVSLCVTHTHTHTLIADAVQLLNGVEGRGN